ncbi:MFS transporter [Desulforegula conservatrix]|uniref:MFS transporter n=1 Tax=Desulforegula conservatrix TaxID=153026 RepID=UPI0004217F37|nr:MFS transporter [Desulforegula conservatrix]
MQQEKNISPGMVLVTVCIAQFMAPFMLTSVGVALPSLGREMNASAMQLGLVEQLYVLSIAMAMLTFGRFGDIVGQNKVFLTGLVFFTTLTFSLSFTRSIEMVMFQRFFQGIGGAMLLSGSMAIVASVYPPEVRARKIGIVSACTYAGLSSGPVIGGYVTAHLGWRFVFAMAVPFGLSAISMCIYGMRNISRNAPGEKMDWKGSFVYAVGIGLFMTGAAHARQMPMGPIMIAIGIQGLTAFFYMEKKTPSPLLDVSLLSNNRFFTLSCLAAFGNYAATFGITFLMSLFLQYAKGLSPRQAGFILLLQPLMQVITSPVAGRLSERIEAAKLATAGMLASSIGLLLAAITVGTDTSLWVIAAELILIGSGFGIFITPNSTAIMGSVERRQLGVASGMIGAMRTLGMAVSMTSVAVIFSVFMGDSAIKPETIPEFIISMKVGLVVAALFSFLGIAVSYGRGKQARYH